MSIKEMWSYLLNKKWKTNEVCSIAIYIVLVSIFLTPFLGIPIGAILYLIFSEKVLEK